MVLATRLDLRQSQSLVMTPQLQQAIKLLALSNLEIETYIGDALEANPLLEIDEQRGEQNPDAQADHEDLRRTSLETSTVDQLISEGHGADDRPLDIDSNLDADHDTGDGLRHTGSDTIERGDGGSQEYGAVDTPYRENAFDHEHSSGGGEAPSIEEACDRASTLAQHLHSQLGIEAGLEHCPDRITFIARFLIDQLDETGYLTLELREIASLLGVALADVENALTLVQALDPAGIGARNLGECIALQAREADRYDPAMARLIDNLDLVARGDFTRLQRMCDVNDEDFSDMLGELRRYDPKPGLAFGDASVEPVLPDILVTARQYFTSTKPNATMSAQTEPDALPDTSPNTSPDTWVVTINPATLPRLIVNRPYYLELKNGCHDKAARGWLSERLTDANWLVKALDQRQKTILKVASELVRAQDGFLRYGVSHLKPLTLRMVAEATGLHESTVSRVTSNKYLHCQRGTFDLKYFFTSGVASSDGEGTVSAESVKASIRQLIDAEDPKTILSDDTLVVLLKERGFDLARRTVAKYREAIGLGSSIQRRRQKALSQKIRG